VSEATSQIIDSEVRRLIEEGESKAREILITKIDDLHKLAKALLEYETLSGDEVRALLRGEKIIRTEDGETLPPAKATPTGKRSSVPATAVSGQDGPFAPLPATRSIVV
jgi:cell division protease FtsH